MGSRRRIDRRVTVASEIRLGQSAGADLQPLALKQASGLVVLGILRLGLLFFAPSYANICSVTSQGSPHTRLQRAIASRNALLAWATASELPVVSLDDALALCLLLAEKDQDRFERAAVRWHARLSREVSGLSLDESALALSALRALPGRGGAAAGQSLAAICEIHGLERAVLRLEDWVQRRDGNLRSSH